MSLALSLTTGALLGAPLFGMLALLLAFLTEHPPQERTLHRGLRAVLLVHLVAALSIAGLVLATGPATIDLGQWYGDSEYALELLFRADRMSAGASVLVALVGLVVLRFAENYLHRDPGHLRFFVTSLLALACLDTIALAATLDLLFMGWELLGLCSYLLIAFYHQREETVDRAQRAIFSYRAGDLGLLLALVLLHAAHVSPVLGAGAPLGGVLASTTGLLLLPTAAAKSGLVPFCAWLARSTEGPTPSTAMFYAGLSVHAGPYLLLRAWPLYEASMVARVAMVALGLASAWSLGVNALTRSDVKGAVVMAGAAQVGLIVAEIGLGLHGLAVVHMVGNIGLRVWQILRAPSALAVHARREALLGHPLAAPRPVPTWLWLWSSEGWFEGSTQGFPRAILALATRLDRLSRRVESWAVGGRDEVRR